MSEPKKRIGCVVVGHGNVAQCMMDAVQGILGKQTGWRTVSNTGLGLKELLAAVGRAVDELGSDYNVIVFSDMPGGSCHHACQEYGKEHTEVRTLTGLNLMMLLEFFVKRDRSGFDEILSLVLARGRDSVRLI
jgi:PTS system mannose-specific IIA component